MRRESLLEPISEAEPCGPDLDEIGDEEYLNYLLPAEDRLPERFYDSVSGEPFDRTRINLKAETDAISDLLERSRDLRLLCLEARFQSFVGTYADFADAIETIAALVERFWGDVHPKAFDGDFTLRQNTLSALDDWAKIIQPLQHLQLVRDKRLGVVTFRQHLVGSGAVQPREGEKGVDAGDMQQALTSPDNREAAEATYASLVATRAALSSIRSSFIDGAGYEFAPDFERLIDFLNQVCGLFEKARPEFAGDAGVAPQDGGTGAEGEAAGETAAPGQAAAAAAGAMAISSRAEAAAALWAAEGYFARREPSAPALILVHQARMLIGKSLVEAIETLLPEAAEHAIIRFEPELKFQIAMPHMRTLTQQAVGDGSGDMDGADGQPSFEANSRTEAASLISAVDAYFRAAEPSSPVPMLLGKARTYLNRDFTLILNDLLQQ